MKATKYPKSGFTEKLYKKCHAPMFCRGHSDEDPCNKCKNRPQQQGNPEA